MTSLEYLVANSMPTLASSFPSLRGLLNVRGVDFGGCSLSGALGIDAFGTLCVSTAVWSLTSLYRQHDASRDARFARQPAIRAAASVQPHRVAHVHLTRQQSVCGYYPTVVDCHEAI